MFSMLASLAKLSFYSVTLAVVSENVASSETHVIVDRNKRSEGKFVDAPYREHL